MSEDTVPAAATHKTPAQRARALARVAAGLAALGALGSYVARRAGADGVPTMRPLQIAGFLEESGTPANGTRTFAAKIFASEMDTMALCNTGNIATDAVAGHFRFALTNDCTTAIRRTSDAWLEVSVVGSVGAFPRVKIGAEPYALEADRVVEVYGRLRDRLNAATARRAQRPSECPVGYLRNTSGVPSNVVLCTSGRDEVVRVGTGASAFWIDRYEASLWLAPSGEGTQVGFPGRAVPDSFGRNGTYTTPVYAVSRSAVDPSRLLTWTQAALACRISGKRLPSNSEWQAAASGTSDGGMGCRIVAGGPRNTGMGSSCRSRWGAEDMVGNASEWIGEWRSGLGDGSMGATGTWPDTFARMQRTQNLANRAAVDSVPASPATPTYVTGLPAGLIRGGYGAQQAGAGVLAIQGDYSPAALSADTGFRCVIAR